MSTVLFDQEALPSQETRKERVLTPRMFLVLAIVALITFAVAFVGVNAYMDGVRTLDGYWSYAMDMVRGIFAGWMWRKG